MMLGTKTGIVSCRLKKNELIIVNSLLKKSVKNCGFSHCDAEKQEFGDLVRDWSSI